MRIKQNLISALLALAMLLSVVNVTHAASEAEKQAAIDAGLAWLAGQQKGDGSWWYGGGPNLYNDIATTGAALLTFIEEGHNPVSGTAYSANVAAGLTFLFRYAQTYPIGPQPAGNPDTNGNGIGVKFSPVIGNNSRDIYQTGLALIPIAAVQAPGATVPVGPQAGRTFGAVIQDTVDYFAYAQNDSGWPQGGWRYYANQGSSDNSTSQWPVIAMLYAQTSGATVPLFVRNELTIWVSYIQNPGDGGSYYDNNFGSWGSNVSRTGTLLAQQVFSGAMAGAGAALNYLDNQWLTTANSTWNGNFGHPYAMWAAYKGLQLTIGLDDETTIANLHPDPGDVDNPHHNYNWWEDYCEYLVSTQAGGTWPGYSSWTGPLATAWYINILAATKPDIDVEIDIKPGSFPSSINLKKKGVTPVAIHTTDEFDATTVDPLSVELEGCGPPVNWEYYDCDEIPNPLYGDPEYPDEPEMIGDGDIDLVLYFDTQTLAELGCLYEGQTEATLTGETLEGIPIEGTGDVRIVVPGPNK